MMTKEEFMHRHDDVELNRTFEAMRQKQREIAYPHYVMNFQMANTVSVNNYHWGFGYRQSLLDAMLGTGF